MIGRRMPTGVEVSMALRILVATMPRAGSTWVFNVVRELCRAGGYRPMPEPAIRALGDHFERAFREAVRDSRRRRAWVLKTHRHLPELPAGFRTITAIRDPRDALASFARFTRCDWCHALAATVNSVKLAEMRRRLADAHPVLELAYTEIRDRPGAVVESIADFLDLPIDGGAAQRIIAGFDRAAVAGRIAALEREIAAGIETGEWPRAEEMVRNFDQSFRLLDRGTGFQSGHVSDYRDGDWRSCVPPPVIAALHRAIGPWLVANGFAEPAEVASSPDGSGEPAAV